MKFVKLLVAKGTSKEGSIVEYDDSSADWLIMNGYGLEVTTQKPVEPSGVSDEKEAAPRRGRPRKAEKS